EALTRLRTAVLLALDLTRVAREVAELLQLAAQALVGLHQRARDAVTDGAGLAREAPAAHRREDVVRALGLGRLEGLLHDHAQHLALEVVVDLSTVDADAARAALDPDARGGFLAPARRVVASVRHD